MNMLRRITLQGSFTTPAQINLGKILAQIMRNYFGNTLEKRFFTNKLFSTLLEQSHEMGLQEKLPKKSYQMELSAIYGQKEYTASCASPFAEHQQSFR